MDHAAAPGRPVSGFGAEGIAPPSLPAVEDVAPPPIPPVIDVPPPPLPTVEDVAPPVSLGQDVTFDEVLALVAQTRDLQRRLVAELVGRRASEIPSDMRQRLVTEVGLCRQWVSFVDDWLRSSWTFRPKRDLP